MPGNDVILKTADEIAAMRASGRILALAHQTMRAAVRPGISTGELDRIAETVLRDHGAAPVFKGYPKEDAPPFPATITASINEELIHGIPSDRRILRDGDLISLDCGCLYGGFVADGSFSVAVGKGSPAVERLLAVTEQALAEAIQRAVIGNETADIAYATQRFVEQHGYSVAREYTGHGVGRTMHEPPEVPNWWPRNAHKRGWVSVPLQAGMTIAIEPMVIAGRPDLKELDDGWTVVSKDRSLCAHFEHTVAVTPDGPIVLTTI